MSSTQEPLIIKDFDQGIADSPQKGFGLFRNVDIEAHPGVAKVAKKPGNIFHSIPTATFTANAGTDVCTLSQDLEANNLTVTGDAVYLTTTGTLPAGLSINTIYFLIEVSDTTFKLATTIANAEAGTAINITDTGTGTHTLNQVPMGIPKHIVRDPRTSRKFMSDNNGRVWYFEGTSCRLLYNSAIDTGAADVTNSGGNGLAITPFTSTTSTWLFVFRNAVIDVIDVFGDSDVETPSWTNSWQSMNTGAGENNSHHAIEAQDAAVYFCDDRYVGSIIENVGATFAPGTGASFTYNNQALDLPPYEEAEYLEELGSNLLVAGITFNKIYPWDRISDSFNLPISVPEKGIYKMKNIGGTVYILAGTWGNIYITQGSYVRHFKKVPFYLTNRDEDISSGPVTWGGIEDLNGALLFGIGTTLTSENSGLYRLYADGRLIIDNIPSTGATNVTAIFAENEFYNMAYSGGVDAFNSLQYGTVLYDNYEAVIQSGLYKVGTDVHKAAYSHAEVVFAREPSGGDIRLSWREGFDESFTTISSQILVSLGKQIWSIPELGLTDLTSIQIQVEMNDDNSGTDDVELVEIRLFP